MAQTSKPLGPQRRDLTTAVLQVGAGDRRARFLASTGAVDRHRSIVVPEGIKTENFNRNPVFIWQHSTSVFSNCQPEDVLGRVGATEVTERGFEIEVDFATADVNAKADRAYRMVQAGLLNAVSIGFQPIKWHFEERDGGELLVFDEVDLLEVSLVIVGSNAEALALRSLFARGHMDKTEALKALGLSEDASESEIKAKVDELIKVLGVKMEPDGDEGDDEVKALRASVEALQEKMADMEKAAQDDEEGERSVKDFVEKAIKAGYPASQRDKLAALRRESPKAAQAAVEAVTKAVPQQRRAERQFAAPVAAVDKGGLPGQVKAYAKTLFGNN